MAEPLLIGWGTLWLLVAAALADRRLRRRARFALAAWLAASARSRCCTSLLVARACAGRASRCRRSAHAPLHGARRARPRPSLASPLARRRLVGLAARVRGPRCWCCGCVAPRWPRAAARRRRTRSACSCWRRLGALQGRAVTADWGDAGERLAWLGWLVVPALLLIAAAAAGARRGAGRCAPRPRPTSDAPRRCSPSACCCGRCSPTSPPTARRAPLPHLPLLNPLDLGIGIALVAALALAAQRAARAALRRAAGSPTLLGAARLRLAQRDAGARLPPLRRRAVPLRRLDAFARRCRPASRCCGPRPRWC